MTTAGTPTRRNTKTVISLLVVVELVAGALLLAHFNENAETAEQIESPITRPRADPLGGEMNA